MLLLHSQYLIFSYSIIAPDTDTDIDETVCSSELHMYLWSSTLYTQIAKQNQQWLACSYNTITLHYIRIIQMNDMCIVLELLCACHVIYYYGESEHTILAYPEWWHSLYIFESILKALGTYAHFDHHHIDNWTQSYERLHKFNGYKSINQSISAQCL